jgi:hypothetical protein
VRLYRILQLDVFVCYPFTRTCRRRVDVEDRGITLKFRSTWNERGNCSPIGLVLPAALLFAGIRNSNCASHLLLMPTYDESP